LFQLYGNRIWVCKAQLFLEVGYVAKANYTGIAAFEMQDIANILRR